MTLIQVRRARRAKLMLLGATMLAGGVATSALAQATPDAAAASPPVQAAAAPADASNVSEVVVTGSRIVRNGNNSPTPLTTVTLEALQATTPSNVPDALNKLPVFTGSRSQRTTGGSTINWPGNFLNLRRVGSNRTLILVDGMRVPATDSSGQVDVNTLPQALIERVDVVTGGASAVYGSDAVTGVVNFVINRKFNGLEMSAQAGTSQRNDNDSWKAAVTAGTNILNGRGHIEGSFEHYTSDGVNTYMTRPGGPRVYQVLGGGTTGNPYRLVDGLRSTNVTPGGYIASGPLANTQFISNGVLAPFTHGTPATGVLEIGGDGGYSGEGHVLFPGVDNNPWLQASLKTDRAFGRFDYDLSDNVHAFIEANLSKAENYSVSGVKTFTSRFAVDNAYLPAAARTALQSAGATNFSLARGLQDQIGDVSHGETDSTMIFAGLNGKAWDNFDWSLTYTHGVSKLHEMAPYTLNNQKLFAALDAVTNPANGQVVCRVALSPASAAAYPGCQPFNAFGPSAESDGAFRYVTDDTEYWVTNKMDDVAGSITGALFQGWAGPIQAALSGEYRKVSLDVDSQFSPTAKVDCTGQSAVVCDSSRSVWNGVVANLDQVSETVKEAAIEVEAPLLKDLPLVKSLDLNAAARYTDYSISGSATTWKVGGVWAVNDDLKLRATRSRDIRAPNLNDLFAPVNANLSAFTDFLTGVSQNTTVSSQGNPDLKPEVATTTTVGAIFAPTWLPGFSASIDWYKIRIDDVITSISGGTATVQQICIASGGTSVYCSLVDRPFPITNTSAANFPTVVRSQPLNSGYLTTDGIDVEVGYGMDLERVFNKPMGRLDARLLGSYQPNFKSFTGIPGAVVTNQAGAQGGVFSLPSKRITVNLAYDNGPLNVSFQERWHGATDQDANETLVYAIGKVPAYYISDMSARYRFEVDGHKLETFLSIENLFNQKPHVFIASSRTGAPGYAYPASFDEDVIGRYFTLGFKAKL